MSGKPSQNTAVLDSGEFLTYKGKALPKGWREVRLESIVSMRKEKYDPATDRQEMACIELEHIEKATGRIIGYSNSLHKQSIKNAFSSGDILYGKLRPNLRKYAFPQFNGVCASEVWVFRVNADICIQKFAFYLVQSDNFTRFACRTTGTKMPRADWNLLQNVTFQIPPLSEQKAIASLLETWDTAIEKTEALIAAKEKQFKWLLKTLICDERHKRDFVSSFATEVSNRNRDSSVDRVLSVTNYNGFVLPEKQFEHRIASTSLSNYKIVVNGQYGYNPSRINVGSIARLDDWDVGVLSPMYVVFSLDKEKINSDYFLHWLSSGEAKQRIKNSAQGSVRETVSFNDLCLIPIPMPSVEKQKHITKILNALKNEISLLRHLVEQYRAQKRGLMQKLLTGEWRTSTPPFLRKQESSI